MIWASDCSEVWSWARTVVARAAKAATRPRAHKTNMTKNSCENFSGRRARRLFQVVPVEGRGTGRLRSEADGSRRGCG